MLDALVVGSGPAGTFCAREWAGRDVLVLDAGFRAPGTPRLAGNLYELRKQRDDLFPELIGERFESLRNVRGGNVSLKLKAPYTAYIIQDWEKLAPVRSETFEAAMSFAQGGLANAWGAGVYRFQARDLAGFPIDAEDLAPFYDELTEHIGVSGANDDLAEDFGVDMTLDPPLRPTALAADLLARYSSNREQFQRAGIRAGLPRLAVITRPRPGRDVYAYENLEFFKPYNPAIYNPVFTLDELAARGAVQLKRGYLVTRYREMPSHVEVVARNLGTGQEETFAAKTLFLAAGTLSTTRIVLESNADYEARLPILDNPMSIVPLIRFDRIGAALEIHDSSLAQLNVIYEDRASGELLQGSLYGATGPLRSDVLFQFPLTVSASLAWARYLAPALSMLMLFYPARPDRTNYVRLDASGALDIHYTWKGAGEPERRLLRAFRRIGYHGFAPLCRYAPAGSSLHYAGTLPMRASPRRYETDRDGRLQASGRVYVCDGACFTALPAKNLTFSIMANAMRISRKARQETA